jgi:hypothetical protein
LSDSTRPDPKNRKKFMFYDSEERQTQLRIRCGYDNVTQSQFFRMMMTGYLDNDPAILGFIEDFKEKHAIQGKEKRNYIKKMHIDADATTKKFGLNKEEIESIFDIIEMEHPEL